MVFLPIMIGAALIGIGFTRILQKGRNQYEAAQEAGVEDPLYEPWYPGKQAIEDLTEAAKEPAVQLGGAALAIGAIAAVILLMKRR